MIVTTMNDIPGYEVDEVYGEVFGLDRSLAQHRLAVRREPEVDARRRAEGDDEGARRQPPRGDGADDRGGGGEGRERVIAMRFDTSEMGPNWTEICAYGTAVRVRKA